MPKKTLQQVADDEVIHKLAPITDLMHLALGSGPSQYARDMGMREVWGVKEAKTQLPTLLREASAGEIHFVTAGDGSPIVMVSAKILGDAMSTLEERRGLTLSDAIGQLPFPHTDLKPVKRRRRARTRGVVQRTRHVEHA